MRGNKQLLKLVLLGVFAMFMLNFPMLSLSANSSLVFGWPALYVYIFLVWLIVLTLLYFILKGKSDTKKGASHD